MVSEKNVNTSEFIKLTAAELDKSLKRPAWADYIKTGISRERPPEQKNWWALRAASVLRRIYIDGPVGVSRLRSYYGGRHRRGHKMAHFAKSSGKIIRVILQDLEKLGYIKKVQKTGKTAIVGREITPAGQKFLSSVAKQVK